MCGILFSAHFDEENAAFANAWHELQAATSLRGPDAQETYKLALECTSCDAESPCQKQLHLDFFSSELRLRGDKPIVQPHRRNGDVLCWNGEVFGGLDVRPVAFFLPDYSGKYWQISADENDGVKLSEKLGLAKTVEDVRDVFASIEGPYAFVYYQGTLRRLFFARDPLGRRSLLTTTTTTTTSPFILTSVSSAEQAYEFGELPTRHIFYIDFSTTCFGKVKFSDAMALLPRLSSDLSVSPLTPYGEPSTVNRALPPSDFPLLESLETFPTWLEQPVDGLINCLSKSVRQRVANIPLRSSIQDARAAVLFSGGIDCTVIAYLAHLHLPLEEPIDLLNVAFENPRKNKANSHGNTGSLPRKERREKRKQLAEGAAVTSEVSYRVPDRVTGLQEVEELRRLAPDRIWNFVEVNVTYEESRVARPTIASLMLPGRTVMDMSLAMALYFASRGVGQLTPAGAEEPIPYTSNARVLLNGLGSDELLGGYGRHRTAFNKGGWEAVIEELQLEIDRIPTRNLGRDDRVISSHGKETRHPFLSLSVVEFLAKLPVHHKMDARLPTGLGDKLLLRLAAYKLGLVDASSRKKKAMQFGSHSARMEEGAATKGDMLIE